MSEIPRPYAAYLGDGVYADFDGYQISLAANDHRNVVIYLEPKVMQALKTYEARLIGMLEKELEK